METNILNQFTANYKHILIDEIALEGLEGISVDLLWRRLRKCLSAEITDKMKARYWTYIVNCGKVSVYELPEPLPHVQLLDRFEIIDENTGHLKEPDCYFDGPYEYKPIEGEYGSSKYYDTRKLIPPAVLKSKPYAAIISEYGDTLALVANKEDRWRALAPHMPISYLAQMTSVHYCMLELIGKSRSNGQSTVGLTNLSKIIKDPKALFYSRNYLRGLDLIGSRNLTMIIAGKGVKVLLVRLKRFNQPSILTMPKSGGLHDVIEYLMKKPDYSEKIEVILKKGLITQKQNRRLQKTVNIFNFEERTVIADEKSKKTKGNLKRKFIFLSSKSDESSESDEDSQEPPLKCQYKVGVSLMRQAYERVLDAGLEGLTQLQLAQLLGVEFYTSRGICKLFKQRNIVREYLEDKGKQRIARYIAIAATGEMDVKYAEEKKKFLEYLKENQIDDEPTQKEVPQEPTTSGDDDIPLKRIKLEKEKGLNTEIDQQPPNKDNCDETNTNMDVDTNPEHVITEVKVLEGFESAKSLGTFKKNPTLRQLTFANGIFKVLKDRQYVCGYITLTNLVAKEVNEPPMDTKALKSFIQKLVTDGHVKIYKIKWPGIQKYSVLICAPHVKATDPLMKAKYKEICLRAIATKKMNIKKDNQEETAPCLTQFSYPRYMKIQKLHEFLIKFAYFEHVPPESHSLPRGFVSIVDFIQEVTIEFVINNLGTMGKTEINQLIKESHLQMKLKDVPKHIYETLLGSNTLQNALRLNLKVLAMLGLIQLVKQPAQSNNSTVAETYTSFLFFVNRRASILDTSGIWPRTTEEKVTEKSYYFETFEDVTRYWSDVYQISTNTVIELAKRGRKQLRPPQRLEEEVQTYDNGARHGDGNGPCGFDSCFYMEIPRLWQTYYMRPVQSHVSPKKKISVKLPKLKINKKRTKPKPPPKAPVERSRMGKLARRRNDGTVRWSKQEDMIITMCKAAITIMSPNSQPGSVIVRNIASKDILSIKDPKKTKVVCHRRALVLESNGSLFYEKQCIINEMKRRPNLIQKYEGLLKKMKIQYSANMTKFINKARIPMMELVWLISEVMRSRSYSRQVPCVALDLEDFHNHFTITASSESKMCNMFRTPDHVELKETIVLTIMQTLDSDISTDLGKKIYNTFKQYPERSLRAAVDQLRKCGAIAAKEKIFNNLMRKQDLEDICQSSYKISALYQRKWSNRLNSDYVDNICTILDAEQTENDVKGSAEINTVYCEMHAYNVLDVESTTAPVITAPPGAPIMQEEINVLTIDTKYKLKTGTLRLKNKSDVIRISDLFKHLDTDNGVKYLSSYPAIDGREIKSKLDTEDPIVLHLDKKAENGATFAELQNVTGFDDAQLIKKLQELEMKKVAKRVGFYENVIVLTKHIKPWTVKIGEKYIIVTPWLTLTGKVKLEIFFKWCGVVMNLIFEKPGSSVVYLSEKCEYLTYRAVQDICMFLEKYECIKLCTVTGPEVDLFSDDDNEEEITEFNPYAIPEKIVAHPLKNSLTKYCYVKKKIIDSQSDESLMDKLFRC
uniref:B-block binding subunit of TFIIIC domain-containing protein n=1 Tax=Heliothis virescens TaxID=7102 RepID=A0A2A4K710_HELVI